MIDDANVSFILYCIRTVHSVIALSLNVYFFPEKHNSVNNYYFQYGKGVRLYILKYDFIPLVLAHSTFFFFKFLALLTQRQRIKVFPLAKLFFSTDGFLIANIEFSL